MNIDEPRSQTAALTPRLSSRLCISHRHKLSCQQEAEELSSMHPHLPAEIE